MDYIQKTNGMARKIKKALHKGIIMQGSSYGLIFVCSHMVCPPISHLL